MIVERQDDQLVYFKSSPTDMQKLLGLSFAGAELGLGMILLLEKVDWWSWLFPLLLVANLIVAYFFLRKDTLRASRNSIQLNFWWFPMYSQEFQFEIASISKGKLNFMNHSKTVLEIDSNRSTFAGGELEIVFRDGQVNSFGTEEDCNLIFSEMKLYLKKWNVLVEEEKN